MKPKERILKLHSTTTKLNLANLKAVRYNMLENVVLPLTFRFKLKKLRQGELGQPQQQAQTNQVKTLY